MAEYDGITKVAAHAPSAKPSSNASLLVKKAKTGGRKKASIEEQMAKGRIASEIASWNDDTTLSAELSAIYLGISLKQLGELRVKAKVSDGTRGVEGPKMIKIIDKGSVGQNQPVNYKLGALRIYQAKNTSTNSFDSALNAGLLGWATIQMPFFAQVEVREDRGRKVLLGNAWQLSSPGRERRFQELAEDKIRIVWLTPLEASASRWDDVSKHKAFAKIGLAMMKSEARAVNSAIEGTEISMAAAEGKPKKIAAK